MSEEINRVSKKKLRNYQAEKLSQAKSAHQVLKKEIEKQKNLFVGVKFE